MRASTERRTPPAVPGNLFLGNALDFRKNPIALLKRGYELHGPIFSIRLGPMKAAVTLGPEHQKVFFTAPEGRLSMAKVYKAFVPIFGDGFTLAAPPAEYKEQRAILQPIFTPQKMQEHVEVMRRETLRWLERLGDEGEFELCEELEQLCLHIVACAVMGYDFRARMGDDFFRLYRDVVNGIDFVLPPYLPLPRFRRRDRARRILHSRIRTMIEERRASPTGHGDFFQTLAEAKYSNGEPVPVERLESMTLFFVFSASESTPLQAGWALIHLLQHPDYLRRVLEEVETVVNGREEPITPEALDRLERMEWALKESERLRPMTTMLWRATEVPYDVGDYHVPKGWITIISPALTHRLPSVFPNPETYEPDRFGPERAEDRRTPYALAGFGGGHHHCPGMRFAYNLMKTIFGLLLQRYTLELVNPDPQPDFSTTITRPQAPCRLRYRARSGAPI